MTTTDLQTIPDDIDTIKDNFDLPKAFKLRFKQGLSLREIGKIFNVHHSVVDTRLQRILSLLPDPTEVENYRKNKVDILDAVEYKLVCNLLDADKLKDASLNNVAYSFQQVANQCNLSKGLATERIDSVSITASLTELDKRKSDLLRTITIQDIVPAPDSTKS